jgi:hypothetical protein
MNIQTVADNLRNTIAGKVEMLKFIRAKQKFEDVTSDAAGRAANYATARFLEVNINELEAILKDVEACK